MGENPALVRRAYAAWNRADWDAVTALMHADVQIDASARILNPTEYRGVDSFARLTSEVFDVWEEWRLAPEELIEADDDRVFAAVRVRARGRGSGLGLDEIVYHVWTLRGGCIAHVSFHHDRQEALAAAGRSGAG